MYQTIEDANMRLSGSIIRYDRKPILVRDVVPERDDNDNRTGIVYFTYLSDNKNMQNAHWKDPKFDKSNIPLGYVNNEKLVQAMYASRVPSRQYKQGLTRQTLKTDIMYDWVSLQPLLHYTVMGLYPEYGKAIELVSAADPEEEPRLAFDRRIAVRKSNLGQLLIEYRGKEVAYENGSKFKLGDQFFYLKENLENAGVEIE